MSRKNIIFFVVTGVVVLLDQLTKWWVFTNLQYRVDEVEIIPGLFSIVHAQNPGAAGGFLRDFQYRIPLFIGFTFIALFIVGDMQRKLADNLRFLPTVLGMILGGAIGNGIDRVHKQTVTDFLRFYTDSPSLKPKLIEWFGTAEYPSFNVADMALVIGVCLFIVHYLFLDEGELDGGTKGKADDKADPENQATEPVTDRR